MAKEVTKRAENYSQWYNDLALKADLAEQSAVRGCMVIKPYGYAIWETMQHTLDAMFMKTGVQNAYFPLFIPKSFFSREAEHVAGFAKECAVVTHHRLMNDPEGNGIVVDPSAKLEEELDYLITVRRKEIAQKLKEARSFGDLSENAEYRSARRAFFRNESRIKYLKKNHFFKMLRFHKDTYYDERYLINSIVSK